jgi:hypothetical protein
MNTIKSYPIDPAYMNHVVRALIIQSMESVIHQTEAQEELLKKRD